MGLYTIACYTTQEYGKAFLERICFFPFRPAWYPQPHPNSFHRPTTDPKPPRLGLLTQRRSGEQPSPTKVSPIFKRRGPITLLNCLNCDLWDLCDRHLIFSHINLINHSSDTFAQRGITTNPQALPKPLRCSNGGGQSPSSTV